MPDGRLDFTPAGFERLACERSDRPVDRTRRAAQGCRCYRGRLLHYAATRDMATRPYPLIPNLEAGVLA
jgi:hypothetical protein